MDHLEKIAIGLLLFGITSVTAYLFRMRQLYVTSPRLFKHASLSADGSMCEVLIYNQGNQPEEEIRVELPQGLQCELLASSVSSVTLTGSVIEIERLHKLKSASILLLVENGTLTSKELSVASKHVAGKTIPPDRVPVNYARLFLGATTLFATIVVVAYMPNVFNWSTKALAQFELKSLSDRGWDGLENYYWSDLRKSYSNLEFPLKIVSHHVSGGLSRATFDIYNKSAERLVVSADRAHKRAAPGGSVDIANYSRVEIAPMSTGKIDVSVPHMQDQPTLVEFNLRMGDGFYVRVISKLPLPTQ